MSLEVTLVVEPDDPEAGALPQLRGPSSELVVHPSLVDQVGGDVYGRLDVLAQAGHQRLDQHHAVMG